MLSFFFFERLLCDEGGAGEEAGYRAANLPRLVHLAPQVFDRLRVGEGWAQEPIFSEVGPRASRDHLSVRPVRRTRQLPQTGAGLNLLSNLLNLLLDCFLRLFFF